jgi:biopolymer transport protein ExbD
MKFKRKVFLETGRLDIAPLIDVVFLLLIFFMLTSSFIFQPGIRVNLPKAVTSEILQKELLVVVITESNEIFISERPITRDELVSRVTLAARDGQSLLIKADKQADLGKVIEIWDICRQFDVKRISIATTQ